LAAKFKKRRIYGAATGANIFKWVTAGAAIVLPLGYDGSTVRAFHIAIINQNGRHRKIKRQGRLLPTSRQVHRSGCGEKRVGAISFVMLRHNC
jgi:hypothetical protein